MSDFYFFPRYHSSPSLFRSHNAICIYESQIVPRSSLHVLKFYINGTPYLHFYNVVSLLRQYLEWSEFLSFASVMGMKWYLSILYMHCLFTCEVKHLFMFFILYLGFLVCELPTHNLLSVDSLSFLIGRKS